MKKNHIFIMIIVLIILTGCKEMTNTPIKKTEIFLNKYQTLDKQILDELENSTDNINFDTMNKECKELYIKSMKKQYEKLVYDIKEEKIDGRIAIVDVSIEVFDYAKSISESNKYIEEHKEEFLTNNNYDIDKANKYKLEKMLETKDKIKYYLNLHLTNIEGTWSFDGITDIERKKIQGIYDF